ncbi:PREDICTED: probable WRKY transcription factor 23 [Camelina sativa]|uniref:Probable WRKY transcription factor 23 n=1 Tax=Camelina sativa TaxID=90675 RepID=A0ABM0ZNY2_CAMSA|nr:PREDICTED: probable WRKY transcription factor 23 [Camelina sativa]
MEFTDFSKTSFYYPSSQGVWDFGDLAAAERNSLGFMELLGSQPHHHHHHHDFATTTTVSPHSLLIETPQTQTQTQLSTKLSSPVSTILEAPPPPDKAASKVESFCSDQFSIHPPATPNSSSISSASSEAVNEEKPKREDNQVEEEEDVQEKSHPHTKKQLKAKKNNNQKKRQREARVAFMTKSEVDHLEDGYRWRKYGQKAVKNSPFPRSYYRCTTASCNVKKRVERSFRDPSTVVTTYEGQHTHISPLTSRPISTGAGFYGSSGAASNLGNGCFGFPIESSTLISPQFQQLVHYHQQQQQQQLLSCFGGVCEYLNNTHANEFGDDDDRVKRSRGLVNKDNGLLQDVVPYHMLKED